MNVKLTNGVSWGKKYVVTSADVTATKVEFAFVGNSEVKPSYDLAFNVMVVRDNIILDKVKATITSNTVTIESNGTDYVLTANDVIYIVANRTE